MAYPLGVSQSPIMDPLGRPLLAALEFQIEGQDAPSLDAYQSGDIASTESGTLEAVVRYQAQQGGRPAGPGGDLLGGLVSPQASPDFFESRQETPGLQIVFTWSDLASFMWFEPFEETTGEIAERSHDDFFSDADTPGGSDLFGAMGPSEAQNEDLFSNADRASADDLFGPADPVDI